MNGIFVKILAYFRDPQNQHQGNGDGLAPVTADDPTASSRAQNAEDEEDDASNANLYSNRIRRKLTYEQHNNAANDDGSTSSSFHNDTSMSLFPSSSDTTSKAGSAFKPPLMDANEIAEPRTKSTTPAEDERVVKCLYYTQQCCECSIS